MDHQFRAFPPSLKRIGSQPAALAPQENGFLELIGCQAQSIRCPQEHVSMTNLRGRVRAFPHSLPLRENNSCVDVGRLNIHLLKGYTKPQVIDNARSYWFVGFYIICSACLSFLFWVQHYCSSLQILNELDNLPVLLVCEYFQFELDIKLISPALHFSTSIFLIRKK